MSHRPDLGMVKSLPLFAFLALCRLLGGCSSSREPMVVREERAPAKATPAQPPPAVAVLFERLLAGEDRAPPLFGPGDSVTVGARRWSRGGRYLGRHAWATSGQVRPIAITGTEDHPTIVALAWSGLDGLPHPMDHVHGPGDASWLITAAPDGANLTTAAETSADFLDTAFELSPDRTALTSREGDSMVVRALPSGNVIARAPIGDPIEGLDDEEGERRACWIDDTRIAWLAREAGAPVLRTLTLRSGQRSSVALAASSSTLWCDPAGGAAALTVASGAIAVVDLATGGQLASVAAATAPVAVAVGDHGKRLALATDATLTLYHRDGAQLAPLFRRTALVRAAGTTDWPHARARLRFSPDGARLACTRSTLVVIGPASEARPRPPMPHLAFELPAGFRAIPPESTEQDAWSYAQLPSPSGFTDAPALLVNAAGSERLVAHVVALALDRDELSGIPSPDARDDELRAFGTRVMPQLFESWQNAELGTERDAEFTMRVGRTDGMPWFETREVWRDGCEPYDGYTRVVVDREAVFVIRALTAPGGSIDGWLARFFDLPFGVRTKTARARGPKMGPC